MATSVTFNGSTYSIPANREPRGWGTSLSSFLVDVANSSLSKAGGNFTLTADANFGANYGLVVKYLKSASSNIALSGVLRYANNEGTGWRNAANSADLILKVNASNRLEFNGENLVTPTSTDTLTNKTIVAANNTITTASTGNLAATELNAALAELQTDIDTRQPLDSDLTALAGLSTTGLIKRTGSGTANTTDIRSELGTTTKGDIIADTGAAITRVPVGTNGQVLTADSAQSSGLNWTSPLTNPMTTSGDIIYGGVSGAATRLAANSTATKKFLRSVSSGTPTWEEVDTVKGQTSGSVIAAGYVGERQVQATTSVSINTATWVDGNSLTLSAGVWLISAVAVNDNAASNTGFQMIVSTTAGNSTSGATLGQNWVAQAVAANATGSACIPAVYANISSSTTYYQKFLASGANTTARAQLQAVRIA